MEQKLYYKLAEWWPLFSAPEDYREEADFFRELLAVRSGVSPKTVLELGSGGGNNALFMKQWFDLTLTDLSEDMLRVSRKLSPECEHIRGDMRTLRLGKEFDAVFVHDAVMYMITENDLRKAIETAFIHVKPGGAVLFAPDYTKETFVPETSHGGHDAPDGRGIRYLEWKWVKGGNGSFRTSYDIEFSIILREKDGMIRHEYDHHEFGLFFRADWLRLLEDSGFKKAQGIMDPYKRELFLATK